MLEIAPQTLPDQRNVGTYGILSNRVNAHMERLLMRNNQFYLPLPRRKPFFYYIDEIDANNSSWPPSPVNMSHILSPEKSPDLFSSDWATDQPTGQYQETAEERDEVEMAAIDGSNANNRILTVSGQANIVIHTIGETLPTITLLTDSRPRLSTQSRRSQSSSSQSETDAQQFYVRTKRSRTPDESEQPSKRQRTSDENNQPERVPIAVSTNIGEVTVSVTAPRPVAQSTPMRQPAEQPSNLLPLTPITPTRPVTTSTKSKAAPSWCLRTMLKGVKMILCRRR